MSAEKAFFEGRSNACYEKMILFVYMKKKLTFLLIMLVRPRGGGIKALVNNSAKYASFFGRIPLFYLFCSPVNFSLVFAAFKLILQNFNLKYGNVIFSYGVLTKSMCQMSFHSS